MLAGTNKAAVGVLAVTAADLQTAAAAELWHYHSPLSISLPRWL